MRHAFELLQRSCNGVYSFCFFHNRCFEAFGNSRVQDQDLNDSWSDQLLKLFYQQTVSPWNKTSVVESLGKWLSTAICAMNHNQSSCLHMKVFDFFFVSARLEMFKQSGAARKQTRNHGENLHQLNSERNCHSFTWVGAALSAELQLSLFMGNSQHSGFPLVMEDGSAESAQRIWLSLIGFWACWADKMKQAEREENMNQEVVWHWEEFFRDVFFSFYTKHRFCLVRLQISWPFAFTLCHKLLLHS